MKIVVQVEPEEHALALNGVDRSDLIVDQDTYCHFRDDVFIPEVLSFIESKVPGRVLNHTDGADDDVSRLYAWEQNCKLIHQFYPQFNTIRKSLYLYDGSFYSYKFLGFGNIGNEIQLVKHEPEEVVGIVNSRPATYWGRLRSALWGK